ncbi:MAG: alpha/beta fold hydrolase [Thermoleophilaceae bacterium]|nr:alpha/beta fold hydrolase [Thermoleophilaceae bacterium]
MGIRRCRDARKARRRLRGDLPFRAPVPGRRRDTAPLRRRGLARRAAAPLRARNPTWSYLWRRQIAELSARGHRCVALDYMGFGRSDKPPYLAACSLQAHVDNALALIDALDLQDVVLVAHDWGGPIGVGALLERRERS